jgi:chromosome segregation ATPase
MAGEDDEVIVSLTGDTSTTDVKIEGGENVGKTAVSFNDDDADPVQDLKKQFGQMTGRLQTVVAAQQHTEQQLQDTTQRLQRAETQVVSSQIDTVESGIAQVDAEATQAEQDYARAFEAGDGLAMARATRAMQRAESNRVQLVEARQSLQDAAKRGPAQQREQPAQQQRRAPADPVEAVAAQLSPKSAAWIRAHPDCVTDQKMNARMMAAHNLAIAEEVPLDSEEYFDRINAGIKPVQKQQQQERAKAANGDGRRPSSGAASGGAAGGGLSGGSVEVRLTKGEAASATDGTLVWNYDDPSGNNRFKKGEPIGLAEMARRKHEGKKAGLYDRSSFEA